MLMLSFLSHVKVAFVCFMFYLYNKYYGQYCLYSDVLDGYIIVLWYILWVLYDYYSHIPWPLHGILR